jgi:thioredoxin 1
MPRKSFAELINSPGMPVLVDFYATWCGPCKTMAPILEQVAAQHQGKLRIIKIDVDRNQAVAQQFRVQSIPTLVLFSQGQPVWRQAGVVPAPQINQAIQPFLSQPQPGELRRSGIQRFDKLSGRVRRFPGPYLCVFVD